MAESVYPLISQVSSGVLKLSNFFMAGIKIVHCHGYSINKKIRPMLRGRPKKEVQLTLEEKQQFQAIAGSRSLPYGLVRRSQIILLSASGLTDTEIADYVGLSRRKVGI